MSQKDKQLLWSGISACKYRKNENKSNKIPFKDKVSLHSIWEGGVGNKAGRELKSEQPLSPSLQPTVHSSTSYEYLVLISQS